MRGGSEVINFFEDPFLTFRTSVLMSQEFALLQHLKVSVPNNAVPPQLETSKTRSRHLVMSPCTRPPTNGGKAWVVRTVNTTEERRVPYAPMAEFSGEVVTVPGSSSNPGVEYLIYDAKIPSRDAINMQMAEMKRQQMAEARARERSCIYEGLLCGERDDAERRRRLLKCLQEANMERAQRARAKAEAQHRQEIETEIVELKRCAASPAFLDDTKVMQRKRPQRGEHQRLAFESLERRAREQKTGKTPWKPHCVLFPCNDDSNRGRTQRDRCAAQMDTDCQGIDKKYREHQHQHTTKGAEGSAISMSAPSGAVECVSEGDNWSTRKCHRNCGDVHWENIRPHQTDSAADSFFCTRGTGSTARLIECRKLVGVNKPLAERAERMCEEGKLEKKESERWYDQEIERVVRDEMKRQITDKMRKREALSMIARDLSDNFKSRRKRRSPNGDRGVLSLHLVREEEGQDQFKTDEVSFVNLGKQHTSDQGALGEAKSTTVEEEQCVLRDMVPQTRRFIEEGSGEDRHKMETHNMAAQEQTKGNSKYLCRSSPLSRPGPEVRMLYRCPVTKDLLPPEEFVAASSLRRSSALW